MEKKIIPAQKAIAKTVRTTLRNIPNAIGDWPMRLWNETRAQQLQIAGASVYVYSGCDENPNTEFDLLMSMPVVDYTSYQGSFEKILLPEFSCVEKIYTGSMANITKAWADFMSEVAQANIETLPISREVYIKWVDVMSPHNQVLLQIGVR